MGIIKIKITADAQQKQIQSSDTHHTSHTGTEEGEDTKGYRMEYPQPVRPDEVQMFGHSEFWVG
jgi:hypothetical protein